MATINITLDTTSRPLKGHILNLTLGVSPTGADGALKCISLIGGTIKEGTHSIEYPEFQLPSPYIGINAMIHAGRLGGGYVFNVTTTCPILCSGVKTSTFKVIDRSGNVRVLDYNPFYAHDIQECHERMDNLPNLFQD